MKVLFVSPNTERINMPTLPLGLAGLRVGARGQTMTHLPAIPRSFSLSLLVLPWLAGIVAAAAGRLAVG